MHRNWQKINGRWLSCHSWQDHNRRRLTAMTFLIILLALSLLLAAESVRLVLHDGRGPQRPPGSHFEDPRFRSPLAG
jgi:hypothetical protein